MTFMLTMLLIFLGLNIYVVFRLKSHINYLFKNKAFTLFYYIFFVALAASMFYSGYKGNIFGAVMCWYMAAFIYMLIVFVLYDIILLFFRKIINRKIAAVIVLASVLCVVLYGFISAYYIRVVEYDANISKDIEPLKIVQISDTHYGANEGVFMAEQIVNRVNEQNPDIVLFTGDIFDGSYEWVEEPDKTAEILSAINSKYGVYACWGNHDTYGGNTPEMYDFLKKAGINILEDEAVLVNNEFYVIGRLDAENSNYIAKSIEVLMADVDKTKPVIVMDHRPKELKNSAEAGVDITLSGHTHNGQTFPVNLFIDRFWDNAYGLKKYDDMTSIVTSGAGLWGPPVRVGTQSEIAVIDVA